MSTPDSVCPVCQGETVLVNERRLCRQCDANQLTSEQPTSSRDQKTILPAQDGTRHRTSDATSNVAARNFGDYELISEIARGGMGVVFKARQKSLNRNVAVKMILAGSIASTEDQSRFLAEAESAAMLDHPGIVPIYEIGSTDNENGKQLYFSMALIEGQSLSDRINDQPFSNREAAELMIEIAEAVEYAHQNSIIHRDLKPANILIDASGRPRITDFGLAKRSDGDSQLTATGQVMGTPSYMPPEQVSSKSQTVGPTSDVYSLGAILYCMVTGRPPFDADTLLETLTQVLGQEPLPPCQVNHDVDIDLETICLKCLEKEQSQRFQSVREFSDELKRFVREEPIQSRPMSPWERIKRWRQMVKRNPDIRIESKTRIGPIPLVSIAFGIDESKSEKHGTAKGVFAFGDRAWGIFSCGKYSYGVFAYGLHARGLISFGFTSIGVLSGGFLSLGVFATGGLACGYFAFGLIAVGFHAIGLFTAGINPLGPFKWKFW